MGHEPRPPPVYLNITEIRGMPMIIINAYEGLAFIIGLVFVKWVSFAVTQMCRKQGPDGLPGTPVARAVPHPPPRPLRRLGEWLDDITTPTSQRSSVFSDIETKDDEESETLSPTAAEIRPEETREGADATRDNPGLDSDGS